MDDQASSSLIMVLLKQFKSYKGSLASSHTKRNSFYLNLELESQIFANIIDSLGTTTDS